MEVVFDFGKLATATKREPEYKHVGHAMYEAGEAVANAMRAALSGTVFPGMTWKVNKPRWADYVRSSNSGLFEFTVTAPQELQKIEQQGEPYDMKPGLLAGPKHRVTKDGRPYNIVPFFHTKADLPQAVVDMISQLTISRIIGTKLEVRSDDQWEVMRNVYSWGTNTGNMGNLGRRPKWKTSPYSNMYRFGEDKFITFRTVSTKSPPDSWIHPGHPANPVSESVWNLLQPRVEVYLAVAWRKAVMDPWL
ncbi:MAG: hypothetical protein K6T83_03175 [Alicyclobacillus sp.]|nr:hypothetical protein [Alicyclobacillus sp.]